MRLLLLLVIIAVAAAIIVYLSAKVLGSGARRRRWAPAERLDEDGTLHVGIDRGGEFRVVRSIPKGDDEIDVLSDIRIAKRDAADLAAELNRSPGRR